MNSIMELEPEQRDALLYWAKNYPFEQTPVIICDPHEDFTEEVMQKFTE